MTSTHTHPAGRVLPHLLVSALANNWWKFLLRGVGAIVFSILAFVWPGATLLAFATMWGVYAVIDGVLALWAAITGGATAPRWWLAIVGVIGIAAGVFAFISPGITALALFTVIGAWAVLTGAMQILGALRLRKEIDGEWRLFLSGILSVAFGALMVARPGAGAAATVWLIGAFAMAAGIVYVALAFRLRKHKAG